MPETVCIFIGFQIFEKMFLGEWHYPGVFNNWLQQIYYKKIPKAMDPLATTLKKKNC